jgi:hypothetical protein
MDLDQRPRRRPRVVTRRVAGETVLVPLRSDPGEAPFLYTLNAVGAWVWERAEGRLTVAEMIDAVTAAFDAAPEAAERDVREFVDALEQERLLEADPGEEAPR